MYIIHWINEDHQEMSSSFNTIAEAMCFEDELSDWGLIPEVIEIPIDFKEQY